MNRRAPGPIDAAGLSRENNRTKGRRLYNVAFEQYIVSKNSSNEGQSHDATNLTGHDIFGQEIYERYAGRKKKCERSFTMLRAEEMNLIDWLIECNT
jgi:hypothetical protein